MADSDAVIHLAAQVSVPASVDNPKIGMSMFLGLQMFSTLQGN